MAQIQGLDTIIIPDAIRQVLPRHIPIFLVGGAVRDALAGRRLEDLDFVLPEQALKTARSVANALRGDFYVLDGEREIGRVIIDKEQGGRQILDFALQRSPNLEGDLNGRDFTINAMAIDINAPTWLIDPLGGSRDLYDKVLRVCSASSIRDDPVRILRAIRMATLFQLRIQPDTLLQIRQAVDQLSQVSAERIRDEIYRLLETPGCATAIRALDMLGAIKIIFPELEALKHIHSTVKSEKSKWEHTLEVLNRLENLLAVLSPQPDQETGSNLMMGLVALKLGRYRIQINAHLNIYLTPGRSAKQTLFLATLFHQLGEGGLFAEDALDKQRFIHEGIMSVNSRLQALCLSNQEVDRAIKTIANYSLSKLPSHPETLPTRRDIYRYFDRAGEAGIDAGLLFLADRLAVGGLDLSAEVFTHQLSVIRALFEAWWEYKDTMVSPILLVNGNDLMETLNLLPGPLVGKILSVIKEAQAAGEVNSRDEAFSLARSLIRQ